LKTVGRGKRAAEREKARVGLAISAGSCRFKILIWGSDPKSANPAAVTRGRLRNELRRLGHDAFFSEEMNVPAVPTNVLELLQLKEINLVINVAASPDRLRSLRIMELSWENVTWYS
jgi:hypothetical protein